MDTASEDLYSGIHFDHIKFTCENTQCLANDCFFLFVGELFTTIICGNFFNYLPNALRIRVTR